jgi:RNA polymerase sigma-70 factor, ECF subfamily
MSGRMRSLTELPSAEGISAADDASDPVSRDESRRNFAELVRRELDWVWRLLRRIGLSAADADDATQQVFVVAARRSELVQGERARPFLYGTALRVAANLRRGLRRRRDTPGELAVAAAASETQLDELLEQHRARLLLDELLGKLPPELRRVLVLAEIEQLSARQIADLEVLPPGTVASRLRRARALFIELLAKEQHRNPFHGQKP